MKSKSVGWLSDSHKQEKTEELKSVVAGWVEPAASKSDCAGGR